MTAPLTAQQRAHVQQHTQPAPDQQGGQVATVAAVLAGAGAVGVVAGLASLGFASPAATQLAYQLSERAKTVPLPNTPSNLNGLGGPRLATRGVRSAELYYRAAYIIAAAGRIDVDLKAGIDGKTALGREMRNLDAHQRARRNRFEAASEVDDAHQLYGPVLGWYLGDASTHTPECVAADGSNFRIDQKPVIGWPGSVHVHCDCTSGPPHRTPDTVDYRVQRLLTPNRRRPRPGRGRHARRVA